MSVSRQSGRNGSVLIIILWSLFLLSALSVAIGGYVRPHLRFAGVLKDRAQAYYLAKAGVEMCLLQIQNDKDDSYFTPDDLWATEEDAFVNVQTEGGRFSVSCITPGEEDGEETTRHGVLDEERYINVNSAPQEVLKNFFEIVCEMTSQNANDLAASIVDWRDEDDDPLEGGAEEGYYLTCSPQYSPKNKEFEVLEELLLVKGMSREIFDQIKDRITIYGSGAVNINTADEMTLLSLGLSEELVEEIMHFRSAEGGTIESTGAIAMALNEEETLTGEDNSRILRLVANGLLSVRSDTFRARARGEASGGGTAEIVFVFDRDKNIKYWRE